MAYIDGNEEELLRQQFPVLDQAVEFFDRTVEKYVYLMKSEQYTPHDIRVYADRIGYRGIYPECCFMCKWSKPCAKDDKLFADDDPKRNYNFFCMHPTQFRQRDGRTEDQQVDVHPVVYALCVCDAFERPAVSGGTTRRTDTSNANSDGGTCSCGEQCCSPEKVMRIIERNAPAILDILDGIRDAEFNLDAGTATD